MANLSLDIRKTRSLGRISRAILAELMNIMPTIVRTMQESKNKEARRIIELYAHDRMTDHLERKIENLHSIFFQKY